MVAQGGVGKPHAQRPAGRAALSAIACLKLDEADAAGAPGACASSARATSPAGSVTTSERNRPCARRIQASVAATSRQGASPPASSRAA